MSDYVILKTMMIATITIIYQKKKKCSMKVLYQMP